MVERQRPAVPSPSSSYAFDAIGDRFGMLDRVRARYGYEIEQFHPQTAAVDEYVALMNSLHLPNPKMMDVAVPANQHVGLCQDEIARHGSQLVAGVR